MERERKGKRGVEVEGEGGDWITWFTKHTTIVPKEGVREGRLVDFYLRE
jgi:hypothetical protein